LTPGHPHHGAAFAGPQADIRYFDRELGREAVKLLPAQYFVTATDTAMTTVLGSCVSACLHDIDNGVAGMNHFMLADDVAPAGARDAAGALRYGVHAMDVLMRALLRAGARRERLRAKVFGGAAVLPNMHSLNIGERNADFVLRYLDAQRIPVTGQDLRGQHPRRPSFMPGSGKAIVLRLRVGEDRHRVERDERALLRQIKAVGPGGGQP